MNDDPDFHARRHDPDTPKETARRMHIRAQALIVLRAYASGRELIDHDAYRLAGFPPGRTSHQRCSDLRAWNWIERTGARGQTPYGSSAYKCRITPAGMRVLLNTGPRVEQMPFEHYCRCGKWGSFGFGAFLRRDIPGYWFCAEHKHEGEAFKVEMPVDYERPLNTGVPTRYRANCELCGHELDTRTVGVHQWTAGWVMQRQGGGGHGISLPQRENRWAHRHCVEREVAGHTQQAAMGF